MAKQELGSPFLTNLGISVQQQSIPPSVASYPSAFNPSCLAQWKEAVAKCTKPTRGATQSAELWGVTIGKFLDICSLHNVFPFLQSPEQINRGIVERMVASRAQALDSLTCIAPKFTNVQTTSINISVVYPGTGFVFRNTVEGYFLYQDKEDPTVVEDITAKYGFQQGAVAGEYRKSVTEGVCVVLEKTMTNKCRVGYEITVPTLPCIPSEIPSKQELTDFIIHIIYKPLLKINPTQFCIYL